jgi:hypothetical protein
MAGHAQRHHDLPTGGFREFLQQRPDRRGGAGRRIGAAVADDLQQLHALLVRQQRIQRLRQGWG